MRAEHHDAAKLDRRDFQRASKDADDHLIEEKRIRSRGQQGASADGAACDLEKFTVVIVRNKTG